MSFTSPTQLVAATSTNEVLDGLFNNPLEDPLLQAKVGSTTVNQSRMDFDAIPPQGLSSQDLPIVVDTDELEEIPRSPPPEIVEPELNWFKRRNLYIPFTRLIADMVLQTTGFRQGNREGT